jgi:ferredoxin--NADP+ reductase
MAARIIEKRHLTAVTKLFVLDAPLVARNACPGQFVIVRLHVSGERVPISITNFDREAGTITIVVQEVGKTSGMICALEEGDEILDFAGPLGLRAPLPEEGHVVLIGGGFGAGAVYPLARELRRRGVRVSSIVGARNEELLILRDLLEPESDEYHICTDDGSGGYKGFVTGRLQELLDGGADFTHCFAVGPMPMMRAVAEATRPYGLKTMVSLDPIMVDGTGMCGACRVTVDDQMKFACVDGPFFDAHKVNFEEAVVRSKMYVEEEHQAAELAAARR